MSIGCDLERAGAGYSILAPAKFNFYLAVGALRPDRYHDVDTIMVTIGLCDRILVQPADTLRLRVSGDSPVSAGPDNLCLRAADQLAQLRPGLSAWITLDKRIPVGAGLGGGSADAAATLVALNALWELNLDAGELERMASLIGSDVPFCVRGGVARAGGTGTVVRPLADDIPLWFVVVDPGIPIQTRDAYRWLDEDRGSDQPVESGANLLEQTIIDGRIRLDGLMRNDFEPALLRRHPEIGRLLRTLSDAGLVSGLSGSGSVVVGVTDDILVAEAAIERLGDYSDRVWAVPAARRRSVTKE